MVYDPLNRYNFVDEIIKETSQMQEEGSDLYSIVKRADELCTIYDIHEDKDIAKITNHLKLEVLDTDRFIKVNDCKEVTNPIFFSSGGVPSEDGLFSYKIFGIAQEEKAGLFGYINLRKYFMNPVCFKAWSEIDKNIKPCIAKLKTYSIDNKGFLIEDPRGKNGIDFLYKNLSKLKFKYSENGISIKRDIRVKFLEMNRKNIFTNKYIVIPVFYRDVNNQNTSKGSVGVGKINQLYQQLLRYANEIEATQEYGFDMSGATDLRLQETLLEIYDWFCGTNNANIQKEEAGYGIKGKFGILRRSNQSKTSDFSARLVISSPELKTYTPKDMRANFETSVIPLSAVIACFAPFIKYVMRRFFEREFAGTEQYPVVTKRGHIEYKYIKDPFVQFSDDELLVRMEQFIHGYNNRLIPISVELEDGTTAFMNFKGSFNPAKGDPETIYNRRLTWLDVLYMSAVEATRNKMVLISRFPIDSRTNQITTKIDISSTVETEPMYVGEQFYQYYPKFSDNDMGKDTSNMFVDTLTMSNLYLAGLGGDYDGVTELSISGNRCVLKG